MLKKEEMLETIKFVGFDCLNVSSLSKGRLTGNLFKSPYRSKDDFRVQVATHCHHNNYDAYY